MKRVFVLFSIGVFFCFTCEKNEVLSPTDQISRIQLDLPDLQALGDSAWYEGWIKWGDDDDLKSIGVFSVNSLGVWSQTAFDVNLGYLQEAKTFLLTIEKDNIPGYQVTKNTVDTTIIDSVEGPSNFKIIGADILANSGTFSIGQDDILDFNFSEASGNFMLDTPTDTLNLNPKSGLWFVDKDSVGVIIKGLNLPTVPSNWTYEGWIVMNGTIVSTGKFRNPGAGDNEIIYYDTLTTGYAYPGEDFLQNAPAGLTFPVDLSNSGAEVYITLEPSYPDNSNSPFSSIIPVRVTIPAGANADIIYPMETNILSFPSGSITLDIQFYE